MCQLCMDAILRSTPDRSKYLTLIDNLLLHSSEHDHLKYLEDLLKALLKIGLKISQRKCHFFRTNL